MAGCTCDKETYRTSYEDVAETVKIQHTDWTSHQIRLEAAKIFRPQYRQNAASVQKELSGVEEYEGTPFSYDVNGGIRFINGDTTVGLLELHERQKRLKPETYSPEEHQTSLLIEQAFRNGASEVVTSYLHPSGQRDMVAMKLDRTTGKGNMRMINTIKDHSMLEMRELAKKTFIHFHETAMTQNVFVLTDKRLEKPNIIQRHIHVEQQVGRAVNDTVTSVSKHTYREVKQTIQSLQEYARKKTDDQPKNISHLTRIAEPKQRIKNEVSRREEKNTRIQREITRSVVALVFIQSTGIGIAGAFIHIESIAKFSKKEYKKQQKQTVEKMRIFRMSERYKKLTKKEQRAFRRKESNQMIKREPLLSKQVMKEPQRNEQKQLKKKEKKVWKILKRLLKKQERKFSIKTIQHKELHQTTIYIQNEKRVTIKPKEQQKNQERKLGKKLVKDFSVAVVIWILLHMPIEDYRQDGKKQEQGLVGLKKSEHLFIKESVPWLLFAIIWHLAMIRESGMRTGMNPKKIQKPKKQQSFALMPPQGVIFAFAS